MTDKKGFLFGVISSLCFGVAAFFISFRKSEISDSAFLMGRGFISIFYGLTIALLSSKKLKNLKVPSRSVLARSLLASITIALNYLVIQKIGAGLGRATSAFNPIFSVIILHLLNEDRLTRKELFGILLAAFGISLPLFFHESQNFVYLLIGVFAALVASISTQTLKVALKTQKDFVLIFYLGIFHVLLSTIHYNVENFEQTITFSTVTSICFVGIISVVGQIFMTKSYRLLSAPVATSIVLLSIPTGALLEYAFNRRGLQNIEIATATLLILGNLITSFDSLKRSSQKT